MNMGTRVRIQMNQEAASLSTCCQGLIGYSTFHGGLAGNALANGTLLARMKTQKVPGMCRGRSVVAWSINHLRPGMHIPTQDVGMWELATVGAFW